MFAENMDADLSNRRTRGARRGREVGFARRAHLIPFSAHRVISLKSTDRSGGRFLGAGSRQSTRYFANRFGTPALPSTTAAFGSSILPPLAAAIASLPRLYKSA